MFSLFRRAPVTRTGLQRVFLRLEDLEGRATPSETITPVYSGSTQAPANQPPQIVDFAAVELGNGMFLFSGRVRDESPAGLIVGFGGSVATMNGESCVTDSNGYFSITVQLQTNGTDVGWVTASTRDAPGQASNQPSVHVQPTP